MIRGRIWIMTSALALVGVAVASATEVPLRFHGRGGAVGEMWPVTFGVPFPEGALEDGSRVRLLGPDDVPIPIQTRVTGEWFDGSVRWVLLDTQLPIPEEVVEYRLAWDVISEVGGFREPEVKWEETPGNLVVDTGPLRARICRDSLRGLREVELRGADGEWHALFPEEESMDLFLERADGHIFRGSWDDAPEVVVEEKGPERVSVKVEGWHRDSEGEGLGRRVLRFYFYAGQGYVRLYDTFIKTADSEEIQYRNISLHLPFSGRSYRFAGAGMDSPREAGEGDYLLQHKHDAFVRVADGERVFAGEEALGSVTVSEGETAYTVTRRHFREMFPSEFEVVEGRLELHFWPRHGRPPEHLGENMTAENLGHLWWVHEGRDLDFRVPEEAYQFREITPSKFNGLAKANAMGVARTVEYLLDFHGDQDPELTLETFLANPRMVVDPGWLAASGAFWNIAPRSEHYAEVEDALEQTLEFLPAMYERIGDYGLWNFGAYHQTYHPSLESARLHRIWKGFHHGGPRWPWLTFARSGKPEHLDFAEIHSHHLLDIGVVNWECPDYNRKHADTPFWQKNLGGLNRYKGIVHWYGGTRRWYNVVADFALWHYYLTGYQRAWDVLMNKGEYMVNPPTLRPPGRLGTARGAAATTLYRATQDSRYRELAERQMRIFMNAADDDPEWAGVNTIFYAPFVERYWEMFGDDELRPYIIRWAQARARIGPWEEHGPGAPWAGRDQFYNLMALGYHLTGDAGFLHRGLAEARLLLENRGANADPALEGVLIAAYAGGPGYAAQQWGDFVRALDAHYERTGQRLLLPQTPDALPFSVTFRSLRSQQHEDGSRFHRLVFHVRKEEGEAVSVVFPFRTSNKVEVEVRAPDGSVFLDAEKEPEEGNVEFEVDLADVDIAGDYRIEFYCREPLQHDLLTSWPFPGEYRKLVLEMPFDARDAGRFYFMPRGDVESGDSSLRLLTQIRDRYYKTHRIYRPDGEAALAITEQGHVNAPLDTSFEVPAADRGQLWLYSGSSFGSGDGAWIEGAVFPVVSFSPETFFVPTEFAEE